MGEKVIYDEQYRQYKTNLAELMQQLNPKPSIEVIEKLLKKYEDARSGK
ncbi:hypothetical protein L1999_20250 [Neobacillus drentensis]|nr:hypothetical protein [Neobacillus drentensis]ULT55416.1 hypothetical protein L1999_20250 [Neobacillus drentensis]